MVRIMVRVRIRIMGRSVFAVSIEFLVLYKLVWFWWTPHS